MGRIAGMADAFGADGRFDAAEQDGVRADSAIAAIINSSAKKLGFIFFRKLFSCKFWKDAWRTDKYLT